MSGIKKYNYLFNIKREENVIIMLFIIFALFFHQIINVRCSFRNFLEWDIGGLTPQKNRNRILVVFRDGDLRWNSEISFLRTLIHSNTFRIITRNKCKIAKLKGALFQDWNFNSSHPSNYSSDVKSMLELF